MSIARRKDGRWIVKYKDASGAWLQKSFRKNEEDAAIAFEREKNGGAEGEELSMGELVILYLRSRPDLYHATRKRITWLFADEGPCAFLRDKYAIRIDRRDLEHMRENLRARGVGNNTINHYQAYTSMVLAWGADQELIARHPWRDFKKLKVKKPVLMPMLSDLQRVYLELPEWMQWAVKTAFFLPFGRASRSFSDWSGRRSISDAARSRLSRERQAWLRPCTRSPSTWRRRRNG